MEFIMAISGLVELSLEEMNNIMDLFVEDMHELGKGMIDLYEITLGAGMLYRAGIQGSWPC